MAGGGASGGTSWKTSLPRREPRRRALWSWKPRWTKCPKNWSGDGCRLGNWSTCAAVSATFAKRSLESRRVARRTRIAPSLRPNGSENGVHAETVTLTGGRLARTFPSLFAEWTRGGLRGGGDMAALELAARIVLAELATEAGLPLGSVLLPRGLDALHLDDVPRALVQLSRLTRRVRLVLAGASGRVVATAPERFDHLFATGHGPGGETRIARQRPRPGLLRLDAP